MYSLCVHEARAATLSLSPRLIGPPTQGFLEIVTQCKLHDSRISLNTGEVIERRARTTKLRIKAVSHVCVTGKVLRVGNVKGFPPEGEFLFFTPGHSPALVKSGIEREETHSSQDVSSTGFTRRRATEALVSSLGIGEQVRRMPISTAGR